MNHRQEASLRFTPPSSGAYVWGLSYTPRWYLVAVGLLFLLVPVRGSLLELGVGAIPLAIAMGLIQGALYRSSYSAEVVEKGVRIHRGIVTKRHDFIPFARLQAVVLYQGPIQRLFGLGSVVLKTARQGWIPTGVYGSGAFGGGSAAGPMAFSGSIENVEGFDQLKEIVLAHAEQSRVAPLQDESAPATPVPPDIAPLFAQAARALGGVLGGTRPSLDLDVPLEFRVAPSARTLWTLRWSGFSVLIIWVSGIALLSPALAVALSLVSPPIAWVAARVYFRRYRIEFHAENLVVARGIVTLRRAVVPYRRIQNVNVAAGPLERWMGLRTLHIESAGPHIPEGYIDGTNLADTEHVVAYLLGRAERARFDDALGDQAAAPDARAHVLEEVREVNRLLERRLETGTPSAPRLGSAVWIPGTEVLSPDWPAWQATVQFLWFFLVWLVLLPVFILALMNGVFGLGLLGLVLITIPAACVYVYFVMRRNSFSFSFGPSSLEVRYGIIALQHDLIPYRRIQAAGVSSGPIERRWFGLQTLRVSTAGATVGMQDFPAIENPEPYLEFLLTKAQETFASGPQSPVLELAMELRRTAGLVKRLAAARA